MLPSLFYRYFFHCSLLAFAVVVCYSGTLHHSWHFDDIPNIVLNDNIHLEKLSWTNIVKSVGHPRTGKLSRPVSRVTFALNYYFSGLNPFAYHIVNIAIHIICTIFVYIVFLQTLQVCKNFNDGFSLAFFKPSDIALLAAFLWSLHPIQTQSITYIVQRMASMSAMFYLIALSCYLQFRLSAERRKRIFFLFFCGLSWVAGILSKENAILLPLALVAYEVVFFRTSIVKYKKYYFLVFFCFLMLSVLFFWLLRGGIVEYLSLLYIPRTFDMWERLITEPIILVRYLFLLFCPLADFLSLESPIVASKGLLSPPITLAANLFVIGLLSWSVVYIRKKPLLAFAILFYFINHLLESTFIGLELYFEHRNYLPSVFLYFVVSYYLLKICSYYKETGKKFLYSLIVFAITMILVSEGNAVYVRNDVWKDQFTLLGDSIEKSPLNIRPYISLAANYITKKDPDKARQLLSKAEDLYETYPEMYQKNFVSLLYYNAAILERHLLNYDKALKLLYRSLNLYETRKETQFYMGLLFFLKGDFENAEIALLNTINLNGNKSNIYELYGRILFAQQKYEQAIAVFQEGYERFGSRNFQFNLIASYIRKGNIHLAKKEFYSMTPAQDLAYLLFRAFLFGGKEEEESLDIITRKLIVEKVDYCQWINQLSENKYPYLIYPDISGLEESLQALYVKHLSTALAEVDRMVKNVQ